MPRAPKQSKLRPEVQATIDRVYKRGEHPASRSNLKPFEKGQKRPAGSGRRPKKTMMELLSVLAAKVESEQGTGYGVDVVLAETLEQLRMTDPAAFAKTVLPLVYAKPKAQPVNLSDLKADDPDFVTKVADRVAYLLGKGEITPDSAEATLRAAQMIIEIKTGAALERLAKLHAGAYSDAE